ncbi:MAG: hypothetical protein KatS3mg108_0865 [Isosphaeraceae bacterium]|jgi:hypothetical protein|nr:MAG: hypothetical protein KatS3mg108_0865 [Isosphaeraceae bacterium]
MLLQDQSASFRSIESEDDLAETRIEAVGFIFHGHLPTPDRKPGRVKAGTNILHFARCPKLDRAAADEDKLWFRSIRVAKAHLDQAVGLGRWKWCKLCEREITQRILNEP